MDIETYRKTYTEDDAVGWLAIDQVTDKIYGNQEPTHFRPIISGMLGGEDPLDGVSIYESNAQSPHMHFVTYGFSELYYDEEAVGKDFSKFGFELTFRLKGYKDQNLKWVVSLMQNLAKYIFSEGKWFENYDFIPTNSPIYLDYDTALVGLAFVEDSELGTIETPHGQVQFLQMVGITQKELDVLLANPVKGAVMQLIDQLKVGNDLLITDLDRK
jgi:hypothetical protein